MIWGAFFLEYMVRLTLAPDKKLFVRKNIPDLVVIAVPYLRPLRIVRSIRVLRFLRLTRLAAFGGEGVQKAKKSLHSRTAAYVLFVTFIMLLLTSVMVLDLERDVSGANIHNLPDALWWAISTVTTVGYGDRVPVTPGGRSVAVILIVSGIALFGVLTASIAAFFVEHSTTERGDTKLLHEVLARLDDLERQVVAGRPQPVQAETVE